MIHEVILSDPLERVSPPEQVLRVSATADVVWLRIEKYEENTKGTRTKTVVEQAVSLPALREALDLIRHDVDREHARPPDEPRIPGARWGWAPT